MISYRNLSLSLGGGAGATVKSIQVATITIGAASGSDTATISAVDPDNTVLVFDGFSGVNDVAGGRIKVVLTNATTITANRVGDWAGECVVKVTVLEFDSGSIAGVQRGTITLASGVMVNTDTITSVDTSKSVVFLLSDTTNGTLNEVRVRLELTDATTVTATRAATSGEAIVSYEVLEFN